MKRVFLFLLFAGFVPLHSFSQVHILLYSGKAPNELIFTSASGTYVFRSGNKVVATLPPSSNQLILFSGNKIRVLNELLDSLDITGSDAAAAFSVSFPADQKNNVYDDGLHIRMTPTGPEVVNRVSEEKYIAAVLSAEIGFNAQPEFLKAKAIICRTYSLSNRKRHANDSVLICNLVHCQVYKGNRAVTSQIREAVENTRGQIIRGADGKPIVAAFHSNCGGETVNSEEGFSSFLPYLRSVKDTFCISMPHAVWKEKIPRKEWNVYLARITGSPASPASWDLQVPQRMKTITLNGKEIETKKLRSDLRLKSTWFSICSEGDSVVFTGRGYGHGVGLCQEGAMRMAATYDYEAIIHYYFRDVTISAPLSGKRDE